MDEWKRNETKELRPYTCGLEKRYSRTVAVKKKWKACKMKLKVG